MKVSYVIFILYVLIIGVGIFGLMQPALPQDPSGQTLIGLIAAALILAGMIGYAALMFAGRTGSKARLMQSSYPADVEDLVPPPPLPDGLAQVDELLRAAGFRLGSERRGLSGSDGNPAPAWHYHNNDRTIQALVALSANARDVGMLLTSYFADETQLTTRLSRTIPRIERPGYFSYSVEKPDDLVRVHAGHVGRLALDHGKPLSLDTFEAEHRLAAKTYQQNMGYLFDAMWRRNLIWLAAVETIGLLALVGGLVQLLDPALAAIKGLVILVGGAALMTTLTGTALASLRRSARTRQQSSSA